MEVVVVLVLIAGAVIAVDRYTKQNQRHLPEARYAGRIRHLRTGEFPSSCSWCKNTALARKLFMFERTPSGWRASDVMLRLQTCHDTEVESTARILASDDPQWRRICTERCAKELSASEHVAIAESFCSCSYCSARAPASLIRCPNCGALRRDS